MPAQHPLVVLAAKSPMFVVCRWVAVLKELGTATGGLGPAGGAQAAGVDDWQQLHLAPFEGIAESSGESPLAIKVCADVVQESHTFTHLRM